MTQDRLASNGIRTIGELATTSPEHLEHLLGHAIGRQPWVVYGLIRTSDGYSKYVSAGNGLFTLLGSMGIYSVLSILFVVLIYRIVQQGPDAPASIETPAAVTIP